MTLKALEIASLAIQDIYDAAIRPNHWDAALETVMRAMGADSVSTHLADLTGERGFSIQHSAGVLARLSPVILGEYIRLYGHLEQYAWGSIALHGRHTLLTDLDIFPNEPDFKERADIRFLIDRVGIYRRMLGRLNGVGTDFDAIAFQYERSVDTIPQGSIELAKIFLPHIAKSYEMWRLYETLRQRFDAVMGAINHVEVGLCVCDARGMVIVSNRACQEIFEARNGLLVESRTGKLSAQDEKAQAAIHDAVARACQSAGGQGGLSEALVLVDKISQPSHYLVEIAPLRDSMAELGEQVAGAIVMVLDKDKPIRLKTERMRQLFHLSPAEKEVLELMLTGSLIEDIAEIRGVAVSTVRSQAKSIYLKTGCSRRIDLIRIATKISPPIGP